MQGDTFIHCTTFVWVDTHIHILWADIYVNMYAGGHIHTCAVWVLGECGSVLLALQVVCNCVVMM